MGEKTKIYKDSERDGEEITFSKLEQELLTQLFKWCQHSKRIVMAEAMKRFESEKKVRDFIRKLERLEFFTCGC